MKQPDFQFNLSKKTPFAQRNFRCIRLVATGMARAISVDGVKASRCASQKLRANFPKHWKSTQVGSLQIRCFFCIGYTLHQLFVLRNLQFDWLVLPSWYQKTHLYLIRLQHSHSSRYVNKCISQGFSSRVLGCFCSKNTGIQQLLSHFCHPKASKSFGFLFPGDVMVTQCSGTLDGEICFLDSRWFWFYAPKWSPSFSFFLKSSSFLPFHSCFCSCILHSAQLLIFVSLVWFGASPILHHFPFKLTLS